jgi:hypothetical protein
MKDVYRVGSVGEQTALSGIGRQVIDDVGLQANQLLHKRSYPTDITPVPTLRQSDPAGGLAARVGMQGSTKPLGRTVTMALTYRFDRPCGKRQKASRLCAELSRPGAAPR